MMRACASHWWGGQRAGGQQAGGQQRIIIKQATTPSLPQNRPLPLERTTNCETNMSEAIFDSSVLLEKEHTRSKHGVTYPCGMSDLEAAASRILSEGALTVGKA